MEPGILCLVLSGLDTCSYFETWCAEEWGPGEYLGGEDDQTQGDQAIDDEVLEVVPPGDEELLRVGVWEGVDEGSADTRHDYWPLDSVSASDQATAGDPGEYTCYSWHLTLEATQAGRKEDMRVEPYLTTLYLIILF